jgi:hypothetical protein
MLCEIKKKSGGDPLTIAKKINKIYKNIGSLPAFGGLIHHPKYHIYGLHGLVHKFITEKQK